MPVEKQNLIKESEWLNDQSIELWREKPEQALLRAQEAMEIRGRVLGKGFSAAGPTPSVVRGGAGGYDC